MNEEPEQEPEEAVEPTGEMRKPTLLRRAFGLALGLVLAYVVGFFLTLFFWTGIPNPNGIGLISAGIFLVFWLVLTIRLMARP